MWELTSVRPLISVGSDLDLHQSEDFSKVQHETPRPELVASTNPWTQGHWENDCKNHFAEEYTSDTVGAHNLPLWLINVLLQCPQFKENKLGMTNLLLERKATGTKAGIENSSKYHVFGKQREI